MKARLTLTAMIVLITVLADSSLSLVAQEQGKLTDEKKQAVVDKLAEAMMRLYLYPDRVAEIEKQLRDRLEAGNYKDATTHFAFAVKLTDDLRAITNDKHFGVRYGTGSGLGAIRIGRPGNGATNEPGNSNASGGIERRSVRIGSGGTLDPNSSAFKMLHDQFRKTNFAMPKLEVLPGNVGYFRLDMMPPLDVARPTLDAALAFLANTDALIIDVRDTPGGVGGFIPYLMSHFFPEGGKLLFTRHFGAQNRTDRFLTLDTVGGKRRPDVPLFILTSRGTGSAAENLTFTLKHHDRATTVGETTSGAGHSATLAQLGDGFIATIPIADVIHPVTGAGFDGVGVTPDVAVKSGKALDRAHELALEALLERAAESEKDHLATTLAELRAARNVDPAGPSGAEALKVYAGKYGTRTVFLDDGKLKYQRDGGRALELKPLGNDTFRLATPQGVRAILALPNVRFERDDEQRVKGFSLVREGKVEEYVEKKLP